MRESLFSWKTTLPIAWRIFIGEFDRGSVPAHEGVPESGGDGYFVNDANIEGRNSCSKKAQLGALLNGDLTDWHAPIFGWTYSSLEGGWETEDAPERR